jgi:hypothetical protein
LEKFLMGVMGEMVRELTNEERMMGLAKVN